MALEQQQKIPKKEEEDGIKCTDGSIEELDRVFKLSDKYNIDVILDLHGVKGSQNGFDNSGQTKSLEINNNHFVHWTIRSANWIGEFDVDTKEYINIDDLSIEHSKTVLTYIIQKYFSYKKLRGLTVLNEPWEYTPDDILKKFYQDIFDIFQIYMSPDKLFIIHDSFRSQIWNNFKFNNNNKNYTILLDTHQYTAWNNKYISYDILIDSCNKWQSPYANYQYIIGEWSLAIDNCQMWLNGFMDNVPNYPLFTCSFEKCPKYNEYKNDLDNCIYGPFGTGVSYPTNNNECPVSISLLEHFLLDNKIYTEKELAKKLFDAKSSAFEKETYGWIYWNFRTESNSYQWDYLAYIDLVNNDTNKLNYLNIDKQFYIYIIITIMTLFIIFVVYKIIFFQRGKNQYVPIEQLDLNYKLDEKTSIYKKNPSYDCKTIISV